MTAAADWGAARLPTAVAAAGVLMLGLASRWPVQAVTGFRLDLLQAVGPALALTGILLVTVSGALAGHTGGGTSGLRGWRRVAWPARRAVRALGLGPLPWPRARVLLVDPCLLALGCAAVTAVVMALPASATTSSTVLAGADDRFTATAAAGAVGTVAYSLLGAGFVEELLFRGPVVLAARLGAGRRLRLALVLCSGGLFGLWHLDHGVLNAVSSGLWGLLLAGYAARRRSLWPLVLAHGLYDVWAFGTAGYIW